MDEQNKIVTVVEINSMQAQQELVKLNSTVTNTTKTLEERITAKNKVIEIQNQLSKKTISALENERRTLEGRGATEKELQTIFIKLNSAKLEALKTSEKSRVEIEKLTAAQDKQVKKLNEEANAVKSNKTLLREAIQNQGLMAQKYGETSTEAINAAKSVAELKDQIAFNADLVKSFDPDQKFKALGAATEIAGTSIQGVTAGMALFGDTSKATEETLLKVQAAMSFSQALSQLSGIGDQYKVFKSTIVGAYLSITTAKTADAVATEAGIVVENQSTASKIKGTVALGVQTIATNVATAAQWLWNTAVMANPIVALVVAVAAAAAGIYLFTKMLMDSSAANEEAAGNTEKLSKSLDKESISLYKTGESVREKNKQTLAMAKANGESSESIRKLEKKLIDEQIATDKASTITARNTFIQERNNLAKLEAAGASDEVIEARKKEVDVAYQIFQRENKQLDASYKERAQLVKTQEVEIATEKTEARKKAEEDAKKAAEDAKKKAIERAAKDKAAREKAAKEEVERKRREAKAAIDLEEVDIDSKKKKDPKSDTLDEEKDLLNKKKDYELMTTDLLESEKLAIKAKYAQMEVDLVAKTEADKAAAKLEQQQRDTEAEIANQELKLEQRKLDDSITLAESQANLAAELAIIDQKKAYEISAKGLTEQEKKNITLAYDNEAIRVNKAHDDAIKASKEELNNQILGGLAETFGIQKEVAVAQMIMAAPTAIGHSFEKAAETYAPPLSLAMGALGAAATVVPIVKGLSDIKKTRFPGKKGKGGSSGGGSGGSISTPTSSVSSAAIGDLAANNAAQLGVDPSTKSAATLDATNNVMGSSPNQLVFSEGRYADFKKQVEFKEQKTSI
jgi:hypothetical protein